MKSLSKRVLVIIIAAVLFLGGFTMAHLAETSGGSVDVTRINFITDEDVEMSAKLYVPKNASVETPAPGILALPGGNAALENLSDVAIELARRGYVVMAVDPYTIGRSAVVTREDVGSRAAMDYLMSLKFVDETCIGAVGHSAGTGRAKMAVTELDGETVRDGVKAVMYLGAGSFNLENVNMGVFIGNWDYTYGSGKASTRDFATAENFITALGVDKMEYETWYGSAAEGNGRIFYTGTSGHPTALVLPTPIRDTCDFFEQALAPAPLPVSGLVYGWKELGTALAIIGAFMMMFPIISLLMDTKFFAGIKRPMPAPVSGVNAPFLFYFIMPAVINTLLCKWAVYNGQMILANFKSVLRINNVNGFIFWFGCSALLTVAILAIRFKWDKNIDKNRIMTHAKTSWANLGKSILLGFIVIGVVYGMTYFGEVFWGLSPRVWKVQINVLNSTRFGLFLTYFPIYLLFFGVFNFSQTIGLKISGQSEAGFTFLVWLTSTIPAAAFLIYCYAHQGITGYTAITNVQMSRAASTLLNCILTYLISCKVTTYCYKKTGGFHTGAVINAILMTWTAVATDLITVI